MCRQQPAAEGGVPRSRRGEWRANCPQPCGRNRSRSPSLVGAVGPTLFLPHPVTPIPLPSPQTSMSRCRLGEGLHSAQPAPARFHQPCSLFVCSPCFLCTCRSVRLPPVTTSKVLCLQEPCDPANTPEWGNSCIPRLGAFGQSRDHRGEVAAPHAACSSGRGRDWTSISPSSHPSRPTGCAGRSPG